MRKQNEFILSKQVVRSGTSIGANVEEAIAAQSRKDFISKMSISSKEARETNYWLRLLRDSKLCGDLALSDLLKESEEIIKILTSIVKIYPVKFMHLTACQVKLMLITAHPMKFCQDHFNHIMA